MKFIHQIGAFALVIGLIFFLESCQETKSNNTTGIITLLGIMDQQSKVNAAAVDAAKKCETTFTASAAYQQVCTPSSGKGRHFRLEGLKLNKAENANGAFYFLMGQDSSVIGTTTTPSSTTRTGNGKFSFYHYVGSFTGSAPYGVPYAYFTDGVNATYLTASGASTGTALYNSFVDAEATICFDVSAATPPRVTVWVTGVNGANCNTTSTLTSTTAVWTKSDWTSSFAVSDTGVVAVKASSATGVYLSKIAVSTETAIK